MKKLKLALDWTPNINHIGFFVALDMGFYEEQGLEVEIIDTSVDNYAVTPAKKVELGLVDFALCPTESVISYRTKEKPFPLIAIAALLQEDLSAIVVKANQGIASPKGLDGKLYSSYKARYEDGIVKEMIKNDGGKGIIDISYPDKLGIWDTLLEDRADATWIFLNWEGVAAGTSAHDLMYFKMHDYGIPYSYSPVLVANETKIDDNLTAYRDFIAATKQGYLFSKENPEAAITILQKYVPETDAHINLQQALALSAPYFGNEETWGFMRNLVIDNFISWIKEKELEASDISADEIVTHVCLTKS